MSPRAAAAQVRCTGAGLGDAPASSKRPRPAQFLRKNRRAEKTFAHNVSSLISERSCSGGFAMQKCDLTKEDCAEIYHALGCAHAVNLQARIGFEGEDLAKGEGTLFKGDANTIYRAVSEERERVLQGAYDSYPGEVDRTGSVSWKLAEHLGHILAVIGPRGEKLNTAARKSTA
jgi:hypothetical protein